MKAIPIKAAILYFETQLGVTEEFAQELVRRAIELGELALDKDMNLVLGPKHMSTP